MAIEVSKDEVSTDSNPSSHCTTDPRTLGPQRLTNMPTPCPFAATAHVASEPSSQRSTPFALATRPEPASAKQQRRRFPSRPLTGQRQPHGYRRRRIRARATRQVSARPPSVGDVLFAMSRSGGFRFCRSDTRAGATTHAGAIGVPEPGKLPHGFGSTSGRRSVKQRHNPGHACRARSAPGALTTLKPCV
jgi:hypothetical protein